MKDDVNRSETDEDDLEAGKLRMARMRHQNAQLLGKKPRQQDKPRRKGSQDR